MNIVALWFGDQPESRHIVSLEMFAYSGIQMVKPARRAVIVGDEFIGLEMAENLIHFGFEVTVVEMFDQVLTPLDPEQACLVEGHLERYGVRVALMTM